MNYCQNLWKETYLWKDRLGSSLCWHVNHFQNKLSVSWTQGSEVLLCWSSGCNISVGCLSSQIYRFCLSCRLLIMSNACNECVSRCVDVHNLIWPFIHSHRLVLKSLQIDSVLKIFRHVFCNSFRQVAPIDIIKGRGGKLLNQSNREGIPLSFSGILIVLNPRHDFHFHFHLMKGNSLCLWWLSAGNFPFLYLRLFKLSRS